MKLLEYVFCCLVKFSWWLKSFSCLQAFVVFLRKFLMSFAHVSSKRLGFCEYFITKRTLVMRFLQLFFLKKFVNLLIFILIYFLKLIIILNFFRACKFLRLNRTIWKIIIKFVYDIYKSNVNFSLQEFNFKIILFVLKHRKESNLL